MITFRILLPLETQAKGLVVPRRDILTTSVRTRDPKGWVFNTITSYLVTATYWDITLDGPAGSFLTVDLGGGKKVAYATPAELPKANVSGYVTWMAA